MLSSGKNIDVTSSVMYTSSIRRLDKTRRRSINNRIAIYRLLDPTNKKDQLIIDSPLAIKRELDLHSIVSYSSKWSEVTSQSFLDNVKDSIERFVSEDCVINEKNMFGNAVRLAQVFYIIDHLIKRNIKNYPTDNNLGIIQHQHP
jgi:hypothetical protein